MVVFELTLLGGERQHESLGLLSHWCHNWDCDIADCEVGLLGFSQP